MFINNSKRLRTSSFVVCAVLATILVVSAEHRVAALSAPTGLVDTSQQSTAGGGILGGGSGSNNIENLIFDFLDDAGNRLKKSKQNSARQIKQTLRFGRRSDPLMERTVLIEHLPMSHRYEFDENREQQRQLLAAAALADD